MNRLRWGVSLLIVAILSIAAPAQTTKRRDAQVIFKDGFSIIGKVNESVREIIYDSKSGRSFPIFSGQFFLDDHVRFIRFSPGSVQKVNELKPGDVKDPERIVRYPIITQPYEIHSAWLFTNFGKWQESGQRTVTVRIKTVKGEGNKELTQKIAVLTPYYMYAYTVDHKWDLMYKTQEFGPELTRALLLQVFSEQKKLRELKPAAKFLKIAGFMQEAGWFDEAEKELDNITKNYPDEKKEAEEMLVRLRKDRADLFIRSIEQAKKVGQHKEAIERLATYEREGYEKLASPLLVTLARDLAADYEKATTNIESAKKYLTDFPKLSPKAKVWTAAAEFILDELNHDTVERLEEFLLSAKQHERQRKEKAELTQTAEQVLASAVAGWLQGKDSALPDVPAAIKLLTARNFLVSYLQAENEGTRTALLASFKQKNDLPMDVLTRLIRMVPPPTPHPATEIDTKVQTIAIGLGNGGSYLLQLPPNYHHQRTYPVLVVLNSSRDDCEETLKRFSAEAAKQGFILVAPMWANNKKGLGGGAKTQYKYALGHHELVLDTLKDLRRKFQVDSDRVFLFGWEDGGTMAFDVGLEHPDQFAGVIPMNGALSTFQERFYWPNAQYLPFYVIEGERSGHAKQMKKLFDDQWTRHPFISMYVEYRGRGSEWFGAEIPIILDWAKGKKRHTPVKELGIGGTEFRTCRASENRFYWVSYKDVATRHQANPAETKVYPNYKPALVQARLSVGNKLDKNKVKGDIWGRADVDVTGPLGVTLWMTPEMVEASRPPDQPARLQVYKNGTSQGGVRVLTPSLDTLLEGVVETGDRHRLFVVKIDIK